jgi:cytochrome c oxidase subunit 1
MFYLGGSLLWGRKPSRNPWCATGLEWQTDSPPPPHNFAQTPRVAVGPYQYEPRDGSFVSQDGERHEGRH